MNSLRCCTLGMDKELFVYFDSKIVFPVVIKIRLYGLSHHPCHCHYGCKLCCLDEKLWWRRYGSVNGEVSMSCPQLKAAYCVREVCLQTIGPQWLNEYIYTAILVQKSHTSKTEISQVAGAFDHNRSA